MAELFAFLGVAAVVICTPGQDTALTIRNAVSGGRAAGLATAAGVAVGQLAWALAASAGLVAVLRASQPAFLALRLVGAAYLVLLGLQALHAAVARRTPAHGAPARRAGGGPAFRQGVFSNLANPKMAVFFTSLLPQFGASFATLLAFGTLFALLTLLWLGAYALAVARARRLLAKTRVRRAVDAVTGAVLVAFGLRVAAGAR